MATVTHLFSVAQTVWYILDDSGKEQDEMLKIHVQEATVESVGIVIDENGQQNSYVVKNKTAPFLTADTEEEDTFGTIDDALTEYKARLSALA